MNAMKRPIHSRRHFLAATAGGLAWAQQPGPGQPGPGMIVRARQPEDLEMPMSGFADYITPIELFYVRTHVSVPSVDLQRWRLRIEGQVATPLTLTIDDLKGMPAVELVSVIECAGNGRAFYNPPVPGVQWANGAVANARWRGVRLADILKRAGIQPDAVEILFDGADVPIGKMEDFQRALPVAKALDPNTLLAYEMNNEAMPVKHGFPLRLVVPGWPGDYWTKWVTSIRVLDKEFAGYWMKSAYRHPGKPVVPGTVLAQDAMAPLRSLRVKSVIASPGDGAQIQMGKSVTIQGAAWSGDAGPVTGVDVSVDNGRSWAPAKLADDRTQFGWRLWEFAWTPAAERYYSVLARARDSSGDAQPLMQEWNPSGYAWNVVARAGIDVVQQPRPAPATSTAQATPAARPDRFQAACLTCHQEEMIQQQRLTRAQWDREINKMTGWGATVAADDRQNFIDYLSGNYHP